MARLAHALVLALACASCVREPAPPTPSRPEVTPASPPRRSEPQTLPPMAEPPEIAEPGSERGARVFVTGFMVARAAGDERLARTFLSTLAREQFEKGESGLTLTPPADAGFAGWDLVALAAADANSFEAQVRIRPSGGAAYTETLFVGPGPDLTGQQRPWVIRGARREDGAPP